MLPRVFLDNQLIMEKAVLVKANSEGVALKDDNGVTKILPGVYVAEVNVTGEFIHLKTARPEDRG